MVNKMISQIPVWYLLYFLIGFIVALIKLSRIKVSGNVLGFLFGIFMAGIVIIIFWPIFVIAGSSGNKE